MSHPSILSAIKLTSALLICLFLLGCQQTASTGASLSTSPATTPARVAQDWLSDQHAQLRKRQVSDVSYQLDLDLTKTDKYVGTNEITFKLHLLTDNLTIDFSHGRVKRILVNGQHHPIDYNHYFISINRKALKLGDNKITISYDHDYSDNGSGLYRYTDKTDNRSYLYTHFEPYEANKLFPAFDQPNLRATYQLNVTAPADWTVITSVRQQQVEPQGQFRRWTFPVSARFSTYIFPLHAGPYQQWQDSYQDIPLRLFARQSMAKKVNPQQWFEISKKGLDFFNQYFDYRYPFGKLDQMIIPDFNIGGMENVAAITYTERVLQQGKMTTEQQELLAGLILHEISHMWFGDLITIDWWSNLWLKESFATYMANIALGATGLSDNAWNRFYTNIKQAAYDADAKVTTHAIQTPVGDTKNGTANFDAVTYRKGASVLNQLAHNLGFETFKKGIQTYFKRYDYQATTLPDFINTLSEVSGQDLSQWSQDWLYKAGTNAVKVDFGCQNNHISHFTIEQSSPPEHPTLREHALNIGLYRLNGQLQVIETQAVKIHQASTAIDSLIGHECPDMVYPNHADWGFVKVILDSKTQQLVSTAIPLIKDDMLRAMFYQSLWDRVNDQQLPLAQYIALVGQTIHADPSTKVVLLVLQQLRLALRHLNRFDSLSFPARDSLITQIEQLTWHGFERQSANSDLAQIWFNGAIQTTQSTGGINKLAAILKQPQQISLTLPQNMRWDMLTQIAGFGHPQLSQLIGAEKTADNSHAADLALIAIDARTPTLSTKSRWIAEFEKTSGRMTAQQQKTAMSYLFPAHQNQLLEGFSQQLLANLVKFDVKRDQKLISVMVNTIMPLLCNKTSADRLQQAITANPQLSLTAMKGLKEKHQQDLHCAALKQVH